MKKKISVALKKQRKSSAILLDMDPAADCVLMNSPPETRRQLTMYGQAKNYVDLAYQPLEVAIRRTDDLSKLLVSLGASVNVGLLQSLSRYTSARDRQTIGQWVQAAWASIDRELEKDDSVVVDASMSEPESDTATTPASGWKSFHASYRAHLAKRSPKSSDSAAIFDTTNRLRRQGIEFLEDTREFLSELRDMLVARDAKSWKEVYPDSESDFTGNFPVHRYGSGGHDTPAKSSFRYVLLSPSYSYDQQNVAQHLTSAYDELFEACYTGDHDTIKRLCLPKNDQETLANLKLIPLNISVKLVDPGTSRYDATGAVFLFCSRSQSDWTDLII